MVICCDCNQELPKSLFGKSQLKKAPGSRRCKQCVAVITGVMDTSFQEDINDAPSTITTQLDLSEPNRNEDTHTDAVCEKPLEVEAPTDIHDIRAENSSALMVVVNDAILGDTDAATVSYDSSPKTTDPFSPDTNNEDSASDEKVPISLLVPTTSQTSDHRRHRFCTSVSSLGETSPTPSSPHSSSRSVSAHILLDDLAIPRELVESSSSHVPETSISRTESVISSSHSSTGDMMDMVNSTFVPGGNSGRVRLGICAMDKKARSKPMAEILNRLDSSVFEFVFYGDKVILHSPVEDWPLCDVLIAFYSSGYPLEKAERYADLRKPFVLNDLKMQWVLKDRRKVYDLLKANGIDVPRHVFMNRDGYVSSSISGYSEEDLIEHDDHIEVNGVIINKPFVEKPVDADDHDIAIYYPSSAGGGCKKLFRKIGDRSSDFYPDVNEIRRDGSFIYEQFLETQGTDVKMYTVGPDYGHAEARKSPAVDGKVERNEDGKEVRFPVILTLREKEIARRIVNGFKQTVCGFDLLRVQEGDSLVSYVCDVNGWSFVKNSKKYYEDCVQILTEHMLAAVKPASLHGFSTLDPLLKNFDDVVQPKKKRRKNIGSFIDRAKFIFQNEMEWQGSVSTHEVSDQYNYEQDVIPVREIPDMLASDPTSISASSSVAGDDETTAATEFPSSHKEELRCVITVVRHGDRTPKQKLKMETDEYHLLRFFHEHTDNCKKDLKVKGKQHLTEFLETVKLMIAEKEEEAMKDETKRDNDLLYKIRHMRDVLERWKIVGLNRKLQMKPTKWEEYASQDGDVIIRAVSLLLILKWGGNLTKLGEKQSITLGERFRHEMYPDTAGGGILRLHSTFRHDLKIKTSDEGRVMKTAAAFAKGLLELEGDLPPILVSLVHKEKDSLHMLDPSGNKEVKMELDACKEKVSKKLQVDFDYLTASIKEREDVVGPRELTSVHQALKRVGNPRKTLFNIHDVIGELVQQLDAMLEVMPGTVEERYEGGEGLLGGSEGDEALSGIKLYKGETLLELTERWRFLYKKLYNEEKDEFDLSRIPDIHDNVRFDMLHNPHLGLTSSLERLYGLGKNMADCVVPQEYGTTVVEKRSIANKMCHALLEKIKYDLIIARTDNQVDMRYMIKYNADLPINTMGRRVRTRLYFTSESHLHTLVNVLRFPSPGGYPCPLSKKGRDIVSAASELCYLTQIVIRLFENIEKDVSDPKRFRIEIFFSPGASAKPSHMSELDRDMDSARFDTEPLQFISRDGLTCQDIEDYFTQSINEGKVHDDDMFSTVSTVDVTKKAKVKKMVGGSENSNGSFQASTAPAVTTTKAKQALKPPENRSMDKTEIPPGSSASPKKVTISENINKHGKGVYESFQYVPSIHQEESSLKAEKAESTLHEVVEQKEKATDNVDQTTEKAADDSPAAEKSEDSFDRMARILAKQYMWTTIAVASFVFGIGCIVLSRNVQQNNFHRRYSRR